MLKLNCEFCGKEIWKKPSCVKKYKHFYCNRECRFKDVRAKQPRVNCSACGQEVILGKGRKKKSRTGLHFCDNKCKNPYIARYKRWAENPDYHKNRRPVILQAAECKCQNCGYDEDIRMLDIHHYDGTNSNNEWSNLKSLCVWCHVGLHRKAVILKKLDDLSAKIERIIADKERYAETEAMEKLESLKRYCSDCGTEIGRKTKTQTCPVCCKKRMRKTQRPSKAVLTRQIQELGYCGTGRLYGVSDNAIRKWL